MIIQKIKALFSRKTPKSVDPSFEVTLSEWMEAMPNELERDAVGLWQIIATLKKDFELTGDKLIEQVHRALLALFERGALPVVASQPGEYGWGLQECYGKTPEEAVEAIIQEWLASGKDPVFYESLWFALPKKITHLPEPGLLSPSEKVYSGTVYQTPFGGCKYGIRVNNNNEQTIDFLSIPGRSHCLKIHQEAKTKEAINEAEETDCSDNIGES